VTNQAPLELGANQTQTRDLSIYKIIENRVMLTFQQSNCFIQPKSLISDFHPAVVTVHTLSPYLLFGFETSVEGHLICWTVEGQTTPSRPL